MAQSIAAPTFVSGPDDKLNTIDIYKINNSQVINSVQDIIRKYDPTLAKSLAGVNKVDISNITKSILNNTNVTGQRKQLLDRVLVNNPALSATIRTMDKDLQDAINKGLNVGLGGVKTSFNNITSNIKFDDVLKSQQLSEMIKSITGSPVGQFVKDTAAEVNGYTSVIKNALGIEMSGVTKVIVDTISDRTVLTLMARELMPDMLKYTSIHELFSLSEALGNGQLLKVTPQLLRLLSRTFGNNQSLATYKALTYLDVIATFNSVYPGWNTYIRKTSTGDEVCKDISVMVGGSARLISLVKTGALKSSDQNQKCQLLVQYLSRKTIDQQLKEQYPLALFNFNKQQSKIVDPRAILNL